MDRFINAARIKIIAECCSYFSGKCLLTRPRIVAVQETLGNSLAPCLSKQIDQSNPQVLQYRSDLPSPNAGFIVLNQRVVGRFFVPPQISFLAGQLDYLLKVRLELRKVVFVASVNPGASSQCSGLFEFFDE